MLRELPSLPKNYESPENLKTQAQRPEITPPPELKIRSPFFRNDGLGLAQCLQNQSRIDIRASEAVRTCSDDAMRRASLSILEIRSSADSAISVAQRSVDQEILRLFQSRNREGAVNTVTQFFPAQITPSTSSSPAPLIISPDIRPTVQMSTEFSISNTSLVHARLPQHSVTLSPTLLAGIIILSTLLSGVVSATICCLFFKRIKSKEELLRRNEEKADISNNDKNSSSQLFPCENYNDKLRQTSVSLEEALTQSISNQRLDKNCIKSQEVTGDVALKNNNHTPAPMLSMNRPSLGRGRIMRHASVIQVGFRIEPPPGDLNTSSNKKSMTWFPEPQEPVRNTAEWLEARNKYLLVASEEAGDLSEQSSSDKNTVKDPGKIDKSNLGTRYPSTQRNK